MKKGIFLLSTIFLFVILNLWNVNAITCNKVYAYSNTQHWYECDGVQITQIARDIDKTYIKNFQISGDRAVWWYGFDITGSWNYAYYSNSIYGGNIIQVTPTAQGWSSIPGYHINNLFISGNYRAISKHEQNSPSGERFSNYYASCLTGGTPQSFAESSYYGNGGNFIDGLKISGDTATWKLCPTDPSWPCQEMSVTLQQCQACDLTPGCYDNMDRDCDKYSTAQGDCNDRDPNIHPNAPEICNKIDDDCDGKIDENIVTNEQCGINLGQCRAGTMVCSNGQMVCGNGYAPSSTETCDTLDNDCDGLTDEELTNACGLCGPLPQEICDGIDNDCNDIIDDNLSDCDIDSDKIINEQDNCVESYNPDQFNSDVEFTDIGALQIEEAEFVTNEVIVKFKEDIDSGTALNLEASLEIIEKDTIISEEKITSGAEEYKGLKNIHKYTFPEGANIVKIIEELKKDPNIEFAEPNYIVKSTLTPNDPYFPRQWAHKKMQSEKGWEIEDENRDLWGDEDIIIAIVDTGVDYNHPDLKSNIYSEGIDFYDWDNDAMDENGHGTHVAGIAAAVTNNHIGIAGTCWNCKILPIRFLGPRGEGSAYDGAASIIYAADSGADIISNSWGSSYNSIAIHEAVKYVYEKGSVVIAAAGNNNRDTPFYPAAYPEAIAVAATDSTDKKAYFSNYGYWVDVSAPGQSILSTYYDTKNYKSLSGTSMAAPFVAGLAGLALSINSDLSNDQVRTAIQLFADPIESDKPIGAGRINVYKTLRHVSNELPETFSWGTNAIGTELFHQCPAENSEPRSITNSGSNSITLFDTVKDLGTFNRNPQSQNNGVIINTQIQLSDNNNKVKTWIDQNHVYACLDSDSNNECDYISTLNSQTSDNFVIDKGDICDICPADSIDECDVNLAGSEIIDKSGGMISNSQQTIEINIPESAVNSETSISITPKNISYIEELNVSTIGPAYHLTPDNIEFNTPIEIKISYKEYNASNEDNSGIITFNGNNWTYIDSIIDKENKTISSEISHFSIFAIAPTNKKVIGEIGSIIADQPDGATWHLVNLNNNYIAPIVIMQPLSFNGPDPSHIRIRNVSPNSFEFQIEEWDYIKSQSHITETISYLVIESGSYILEDGTKIQASLANSNQEFNTVHFSSSFNSTPIILTQTQTNYGPQAIVTRQKNANPRGFNVKVQEEEANDGIHVYEDIGYIAIELTLNGTNNGNKFETRSTSTNHNWRTIYFAQNYNSPPIFLASLNSYAGVDPAGIRYKNPASQSLSIKIEEEQSKDNEMWHNNEAVDYIAFEKPGNILAKNNK